MAKQKQFKQTVSSPVAKASMGFDLNSPGILMLVVFAFSFLLYFNSIFNDYNLDDELVTQNHRLTSKGISAIPEIFSSPYYEDKAGNRYEYRPVVLASFAVEHSFFGDNPHVSHTINVLLYAIICTFLFYLLIGLLKKYNILFPLIITLVFAAHPIHTEVVASIKNRDELLALLFGLLSLWAALRYSENKKIIYLLLLPVFFLIGLLAKTTTLAFIAIIPLTLIMIAGAGFIQVIVVTATLVLPAIFYARLHSLTQQIVFGTGLFVAVTALYFIKNWTGFSGGISNNFKLVANNLFQKNEEAQPVEGNYQLDFSFLKNPFLTVILVVALLAMLSAGVAGILLSSMWLTCIPLLLLVLAFAMARKELQLVLILPISGITLFALATFDFRDSVIEAMFLLFIATQLILPDKRFRILAIIVLAAHIIVAIVFMHSHLFFAVLIFAWFADKRLRSVSIVIFALLLVSWLGVGYRIASGKKIFRIAYLCYPLLCMGALFIRKGHGQIVPRVAALAIPVLLLVLFAFSSHKYYYNTLREIKTTYYDVRSVKAADPTPKQSGRPLRFLEYPLDMNAKMSLKFGTAMVVLGEYLKKIFVPYPMSFYYGFAYITATDFFTPVPVIVLLIHLGLLAIALIFIRRQPFLSYAILFYLITVSAYSGLATPIPGMLGDRFLLIPSLGFAFFIAFLLATVFKQNFNDKSVGFNSLAKPVKISLIVLLSLYSFVTVARNMQWKDRVTLFSHDINVVGNSTQAQNLLGLHLLIASNSEPVFDKQLQMRLEAAGHFKRAIEIYPHFLNASYDMGRTYEAIAGSYANAQNTAKAIEYYDKALAQYYETQKIDSTFVSPAYSMAVIKQNKGDYEGAIPLYEKYLIKHPKQKDVYANLSFMYYKLKQYDKSIAVNRLALQVLPDRYEPTVNIAKTYLEMGQQDSAYYYLEQSHIINPAETGVIRILLQMSVQKNDQNKVRYYNGLLTGRR